MISCVKTRLILRDILILMANINNQRILNKKIPRDNLLWDLAVPWDDTINNGLVFNNYNIFPLLEIPDPWDETTTPFQSIKTNKATV